MPLLNANFNEVKNKFVDINAGIYTLRILSVNREASKNPDVLAKDPGAMNLVVEHEVVDAGEFQGRKKTRSISLKMLTEIKRLSMSAGKSEEEINTKGIDPEAEWVGKTVRAELRPNVYTDKATGAVRENTQIANYLIPGDPGYNV